MSNAHHPQDEAPESARRIPVADAMRDLGGSPTLPPERAALVHVQTLPPAATVIEHGHARTLSVGRVEFDERRMKMLADTIMPGAKPDEIAFFAEVAKRVGLDPFAKQIHAVKRSTRRGNGWVDVWTFQVAIDGFRLIAERTGKYRGQTLPLFCGKDGVWHEVWFDEAPPAACKVGVLRSDFDAPLYAVARWAEYVQTRNTEPGVAVPVAMWAKMPTVMLAKVSEALALRKAFPQEMSGLYTDDEMAQAENEERAESRRAAQTNAGERATGSGEQRDDPTRALGTRARATQGAATPSASASNTTSGTATTGPSTDSKTRSSPRASSASATNDSPSSAATNGGSATSPTESSSTTKSSGPLARNAKGDASRYATSFPLDPYRGIALDAETGDGALRIDDEMLDTAGSWCVAEAKKDGVKPSKRDKLLQCAMDIDAELKRRALGDEAVERAAAANAEAGATS